MLDYNLIRNTSKQYLDLMCIIGFLFDDEKKFIKNQDPYLIYSIGFKILKEFISNSQSINFSAFSIAFSVLIYLREFHLIIQSTDNRSELIEFLNMKKGRKRILERFYSIEEKDYVECYEIIKLMKNVDEIKYEIYFPKNETNSQNSRIISSNFNSPNIKNELSTADYSNEVKSFKLYSPSNKIEFNSNYDENNSKQLSAVKNLISAYPISQKNSDKNTYLLKDLFNMNNNYNKSNSHNKNVNCVKKISDFEVLKLERQNFNSDKKAVSNTQNKIKNHKNSYSCLQGYLLNQFDKASISDFNKNLDMENFKFNKELHFNFNIKENCNNDCFRNLKTRTQFKSNTSKKLINMDILNNLKNKITQHLNDNIKKEKKITNKGKSNINLIKEYQSNNLMKSLDQNINNLYISDLNKASIEFILRDEKEKEEKAISFNNKGLKIPENNEYKEEINPKFDNYDKNKNINNQVNSQEKEFYHNLICNNKNNISNFNYTNNTTDLNGKGSTKNINIIDFTDLNSMHNLNLKNRFNNNNNLFNNKTLNDKTRTSSDNYPINCKSSFQKIYLNNKKEESCLNEKKSGEDHKKSNLFKEMKNSYNLTFKDNPNKINFKVIKVKSNYENTDNFANNNSFKENNLEVNNNLFYKNIKKKLVNSQNKIQKKDFNFSKNSVANQ